MSERTVSVTFELPFPLVPGTQITFTIPEIKEPPAPKPEQEANHVLVAGKPDEFESSYVVWRGTVKKRTVPFLGIGDHA